MNTYGYTSADHAVCIHYDRVQTIENLTMIDNCHIHSEDNPTACLKCKDGYFLDIANKTSVQSACVNGCASNMKLTPYTFANTGKVSNRNACESTVNGERLLGP